MFLCLSHLCSLSFAVLSSVRSPFFFHGLTVFSQNTLENVSCILSFSRLELQISLTGTVILPTVFRHSSDKSVLKCLPLLCGNRLQMGNKMLLGRKSFVVLCTWGFLASSLILGYLFPGMFSSILPKAVLYLCILEFSVCFFFPQWTFDPIIITRTGIPLPVVCIVRLPAWFHTSLLGCTSYRLIHWSV